MATSEERLGAEVRPPSTVTDFLDRIGEFVKPSGDHPISAQDVRRAAERFFRNPATLRRCMDRWKERQTAPRAQGDHMKRNTGRTSVAAVAVVVAVALVAVVIGCGGGGGGGDDGATAPSVQRPEFSSAYDGTKWIYTLSVDEARFGNEPETESVGSNGQGGTQKVLPRKTVKLLVKNLADNVVTEYAAEGKNDSGTITYSASAELPASFRWAFSDRGVMADLAWSAYYVPGDADGLNLKAQAAYGALMSDEKKSVPGWPGRDGDKKLRFASGSIKLFVELGALTASPDADLYMSSILDLGGSLFPVADEDGDGYILYEDARLPDGEYKTTIRKMQNGVKEVGRIDVAGSAFAYDDPLYGPVLRFTKEGGSIRPAFDASVTKASLEKSVEDEIVIEYPKTKTIERTLIGRWSNGYRQDVTEAGTPYTMSQSSSTATVEVVTDGWKILAVSGAGEEVIMTDAWDALPALTTKLKITPNLTALAFTEARYELFNTLPAVTKDAKVKKTFANGFTAESKDGLKFRSLNTNVATIGETDGILTPVGLGETTIEVTNADKSIVATAPVLVAKEVDHIETVGPAFVTLAVGGEQDYTAHVFYKDGTEEDRSDNGLVSSNTASVPNSTTKTATAVAPTTTVAVEIRATVLGATATNAKRMAIIAGPVTGLAFDPSSAKVMSTLTFAFRNFAMHGTVQGENLTASLIHTIEFLEGGAGSTVTVDATTKTATFTAGAKGRVKVKTNRGSLKAEMLVEISDRIISVTFHVNDLNVGLKETKEVGVTVQFADSPSSNSFELLALTPALPGNEFAALALNADKKKLLVTGKKAGTFTLKAGLNGIEGSLSVVVSSTPKAVFATDASGQPFANDTIALIVGFPDVAPRAKLVSTIDDQGNDNSANPEDVTAEAVFILDSQDGSVTKTLQNALHAEKAGQGTLIVSARGKATAPMSVKSRLPKELIVVDGNGQPFTDNTMQLSVAGPAGTYKLYLVDPDGVKSPEKTSASLWSITGQAMITSPGSIDPDDNTAGSALATFTMNVGGQDFTATLKVTVKEVLVSVTIATQGNATKVKATETLPYTVTAHYLGIPDVNVTTNTATINTSSDPTKASVTPGAILGVFETTGGSKVTITSSFGGKAGTVEIEVEKKLREVTVASAGGLKKVKATETLPYTVTAAYDGAIQPTENVTTNAATSHTSSDATKASVTPGVILGVFETTGGPKVTITCSFGGKSGSLMDIEVEKKLSGLTLTAAASSGEVLGTTIQLTAMAQYAGGGPENVTTDPVTLYGSSASSTAMVSSVGLATLQGTAGSVTLSASYKGQGATVNVTSFLGTTGDPLVNGSIRFGLWKLETDGSYTVRLYLSGARCASLSDPAIQTYQSDTNTFLAFAAPTATAVDENGVTWLVREVKIRASGEAVKVIYRGSPTAWSWTNGFTQFRSAATPADAQDLDARVDPVAKTAIPVP